MLRILGRLPKIGNAARRNVGTAAKEIPTNADLPAPPGKNVIINGNFDIWQRGTMFTGVSSGDFTTDRFQWAQVGSGVVDILRSTSVPDGLSDFSVQVDVTTADASIAAGDIYTQQYIVEGYDAMRFGFGTADAKQITLSFWVRSAKTGTHCVAFQNQARNRSQVQEYTINVADTFEYKTITIAADTAGTWLTDSGTGIIISWPLALGTDFQGVADTWNVADDRGTSNQVNVMDNVANNFHLSRVQLEIGSVATAFERRSFAQELMLAKRYYQRYGEGAANTIPRINDSANGAHNINRNFPLIPEMRATPTMSIAGTWNVTNTAQPSVSSDDAKGWNFNTLATGAGSIEVRSDSSDDLIQADAEL